MDKNTDNEILRLFVKVKNLLIGEKNPETYTKNFYIFNIYNLYDDRQPVYFWLC